MGNVTLGRLNCIGFIEDKTLISDPPGGLIIDFGNFKLDAIFGRNLWGQETVLLSGVMSTHRSITHVEFEMPREVESWEQGITSTFSQFPYAQIAGWLLLRQAYFVY